MDAHDLAKELETALLALEPRIQIRHTDDPATFEVCSVVMLDDVRMRLRTSYYKNVGGDEELMAHYAEHVVTNLRREINALRKGSSGRAS